MKIIDKIRAKNENNFGAKPVTIVFLGDSVTHGCFDCFFDENGNINTYFKAGASYAHRVREMLNLLYPAAQINIINSGISGDSAAGGNNRFDRDVKPFSPDLVVVSYGLNDSCGGVANVGAYTKALDEIFAKVRETGAECIFLTENMMCSRVSCHLKEEREQALAKGFSEIQNSGTLDTFFEEAKKTAAKNGVKVVDVYSAWKKLSASGVDTTELLANKYNHPAETLHYYTAVKVVEAMFD